MEKIKSYFSLSGVLLFLIIGVASLFFIQGFVFWVCLLIFLKILEFPAGFWIFVGILGNFVISVGIYYFTPTVVQVCFTFLILIKGLEAISDEP